MKDVKVGEMIKPNQGKVLLQMIRESSEYTPGITRLNPKTEPYMVIESVGPGVNNMYPGDYVIIRDMEVPIFKLYNKEFSLVYASDIEAVISKEITEEIKKQLQPETKEEVN